MTQTVTSYAVVAIQNIVDGVVNNFLNILNFSGVANAVNSATVTNAATGNPPSLAAVGSDTDIDLSLVTKGKGVVRLGGSTTVANLPAAGVAGRRSFVTDANATTFQSIVASGGANKVPVFDDGTNWRIG